MSERFHSHVEQMNREDSLHYAEAARNLGNFSINAVANEGESFITNRGREVSVGEGKIAVRISGEGDQGPLHQEAQRLQAEAQQENPTLAA